MGNGSGKSQQSSTLDNRAVISSQSGGKGNGGNISINAEFLKLRDRSGVSSQLNPQAEGNGGNIIIETSKLDLRDGSLVTTSTFGSGNAGLLNILATESIFLSGITEDEGRGGLFANALIQDGNGGDLLVSTNDLVIKDGAAISASNFQSLRLREPGTGEAGNVSIRANSLRLENAARIDTTTQAGDGGNITLNIADSITLRDNSLISAEAIGDAQGGNVTIDSQFVIAFPNNSSGNGSDILANAQEGNGGEIEINAESLLGIRERTAGDGNKTNDIDASSDSNVDGNVLINTSDINPIQGDRDLPSNLIADQQAISQACDRDRETAAKNSFTTKGKGGIPAEPGLPLNSLSIYVNGKSTSARAIPAPIKTSQGKIQPARGIKVTESGEIILTAYRTNNAGERIIEGSRNCG